ncbi:CHASE sensor domain-containing protein [Methylocucumis oryzae]|uniref:CHASE sensor domain-containing protein n=1 Tax=Methylocucumis oryzae TaxID=1632867 RepID=UPI0009E57101|nr:CHASE sensor domain-containing protein [Methylocucumis oryzae]
MFIPIKRRVYEMPNNTFANLPITKKLQRLQVITVSLALVFTLIFSTLTELWKQHKQIIRDAESIGEMIGYNAEAALAFDDMRSATEILSALYSKPEIMAARLYTLQDTPLAHYIADGRSIEFPHSAHEFRQQSGDIRMNLLTYELMKTVKPKNDVEGYLFLVVDLEPMWWGLAENLSQILAVMLSAFMLSALYGKRLAQGISIPLIKLAAIAQKSFKRSRLFGTRTR